jgi:cardiolipin synthase (CMP-forming)
MNLPNFISLGRLFLTPLLIWLIMIGKLNTAFWIFLIAGLSDILDGLLARLLKDQTTIGRYLDPIADKVLLVAIFLTLGVKGLVPSWLVILVVFRDVTILGGTILLSIFSKPAAIKPIMISKVNTFFQIFLITSVLWQKAYTLVHPFLNDLIYLTAATTIISGIGYVIRWIRELNETEQKSTSLA